MIKQVDKDHYLFEKYSHKDRWVSYFHQLDEMIKLSPKSVLEIGVGDRVVGDYIKNNTTISYTSFDIDPDLSPSFCGSILDIPVENASFDAVCAFEVLEHLPFSDFEKALKELKRVSKKNVIISLPHFGPPVKFLLKIPFLPELKWAIKIPYPREHRFNGEHYWEIGKQTFSSRRIKNILKTHFLIEKDFIPFDNQYHHFYVLRK